MKLNPAAASSDSGSAKNERRAFVEHTVRVALKDRALANRGHVAAEGVCRVLLELAVDHFAERGKDELIAWEFGDSMQLGEFIHEQAREGFFELGENDVPEDFEGWYDLQADPDTWKLQW